MKLYNWIAIIQKVDSIFKPIQNILHDLILFISNAKIRAMAEYRYILHVKRDVVVYERLDRVKLDTGRRSALFERVVSSENANGSIIIFFWRKIRSSPSPVAYSGRSTFVTNVCNASKYYNTMKLMGNFVQEVHVVIYTSGFLIFILIFRTYI